MGSVCEELGEIREPSRVLSPSLLYKKVNDNIPYSERSRNNYLNTVFRKLEGVSEEIAKRVE